MLLVDVARCTTTLTASYLAITVLVAVLGNGIPGRHKAVSLRVALAALVGWLDQRRQAPWSIGSNPA